MWVENTGLNDPFAVFFEMPADNEQGAIGLKAVAGAEEIPSLICRAERLLRDGLALLGRGIPEEGRGGGRVVRARVGHPRVYRVNALGVGTPTPVEDLAGIQQAGMNSDVAEIEQI